MIPPLISLHGHRRSFPFALCVWPHEQCLCACNWTSPSVVHSSLSRYFLHGCNTMNFILTSNLFARFALEPTIGTDFTSWPYEKISFCIGEGFKNPNCHQCDVFPVPPLHSIFFLCFMWWARTAPWVHHGLRHGPRHCAIKGSTQSGIPMIHFVLFWIFSSSEGLHIWQLAHICHRILMSKCF